MFSSEFSSELYEQVVMFIHGDISVRDLEDWYVPRLPYYLRSPSPGDDDLIATIELALAERTAGILDDEGVKRQLNVAISGPVSIILRRPVVAEDGTVSITTTSLGQSGRAIDREPDPAAVHLPHYDELIGVPTIRL